MADLTKESRVQRKAVSLGLSDRLGLCGSLSEAAAVPSFESAPVTLPGSRSATSGAGGPQLVGAFPTPAPATVRDRSTSATATASPSAAPGTAQPADVPTSFPFRSIAQIPSGAAA